jgi:hypothetical protein
VKSPVQRILVFSEATVAHGEIRHACAFSVVGKGPDDGEAGTAEGACGKRIKIPPIGWVEKLLNAFGTYGRVRGNRRCVAAVVNAGSYPEDFLTRRFDFADGRGVDAAQGRYGPWKLALERVANMSGAFNLYVDSTGAVEHPSCKPQLRRKPVNLGTASNPLQYSRQE